MIYFLLLHPPPPPFFFGGGGGDRKINRQFQFLFTGTRGKTSTRLMTVNTCPARETSDPHFACLINVTEANAYVRDLLSVQNEFFFFFNCPYQHMHHLPTGTRCVFFSCDSKTRETGNSTDTLSSRACSVSHERTIKRHSSAGPVRVRQESQ